VSSLTGVEFRRASLADAEGLTRLMSQPEVLRNTLQLPLPSGEVWRKRLEAQIADPLQIHVLAVHGVELIGSAGLHPVSGSLRTRHGAHLGMCVATTWWGRGVGTELMRRLLDWADNWAGLLRIELGVFSDNERAIALYRKFGFELEGRQRAWALRDGEYVDSLMMARLHPRPPQLPSGPPES
jgi:L-phenylalanine/L-methionine N-acetyltransferase